MIEFALALIGLCLALAAIAISVWLLPFVLALAGIVAGLFALGTPVGIAIAVGVAVVWQLWMVCREARHLWSLWSPAPPRSPPPTAPARGNPA